MSTPAIALAVAARYTPAERLFHPVELGRYGLPHRMVMAPLTRSRARRRLHGRRAPRGGRRADTRESVCSHRTHTMLDPAADARILVYFTTNFLTATGASPRNTSTW